MTASRTWCCTRGCLGRRDHARRRRRSRPRLAPAHDLSVDEFLDSPHVLVGTLSQLVDKVERLRDELGFSSFTLSRPALDELAPLVDALTPA